MCSRTLQSADNSAATERLLAALISNEVESVPADQTLLFQEALPLWILRLEQSIGPLKARIEACRFVGI